MVNLGDFASKLIPGGTAPAGAGGDTLKLLVNGKAYEGWTQITVRRSLKAIAGGFSLKLVDKWSEEKAPWQLAPGDECKIQIGSDTVLTGYVDDVDPEMDANAVGLSVSGRDKTGDLVDCSIDFNPGTWSNISLLGIAKKVASPFGIGVKVAAGVSVGPLFISWKVQQGESCFETLERAARLRGVLLVNDGKGNIVITQGGTARAATELVQGENILSASAKYSQKERFSKYTVKGQGAGLEDVAPETDFQPAGIATDSGVKRYRPLLIIAEGAVTAAVARQRAKWESSVRIGKSSQVRVTIPGWRQSSGKLWTINEVTRVKAPRLGINLDLLITEVAFEKGDKTTTELTLEPTAAYTPDPTLITRKDPWRQLVVQESKRK